jgi:hypothetical protein
MFGLRMLPEAPKKNKKKKTMMLCTFFVAAVCVAMSDAAVVLRACMNMPGLPSRIVYGIRNPLNPPTFEFSNDTLVFADMLMVSTGSILTKQTASGQYSAPRRSLITSRLVFDLNPNSTSISAPPGPCGSAVGVTLDDVFVPAALATAYLNLTRAYASSGPAAALHLTFVHWPEAISSLVRASVSLAETINMLPKVFTLPVPVPQARSAIMRAEWQTDSNLFDVNDAIRTRLLRDSTVLWARRILSSSGSIVPAFAEIQLPLFDTSVLRTAVERFDVSIPVARQPFMSNVTLDGFTLPLVTFSRINELPGEYSEVQVAHSNQTLVFIPTYPSNVSVEVVRFFAPNPFVLFVGLRIPPTQMVADHCVARTIATNVVLSSHNVYFTKLSAVVNDQFITNATLFDYIFSVHLTSANSTTMCMRLLRSFSGATLDASFLLVHTSDFTNSTLPPTTVPPPTTPSPNSTTTIDTNTSSPSVNVTTTDSTTTTVFEIITTAPVVINGTTGTPAPVTEGPGETTTTGTESDTSVTTVNTIIGTTTTPTAPTTSTTRVILPSLDGSNTTGDSTGTTSNSNATMSGNVSDSETSTTTTTTAGPTTAPVDGTGDLQKDESDLSPTTIGIIAGAGGGGLCLGILVAVGAVCLCRRKSRDDGGGARQPSAEDPDPPMPETAGVTTASASGDVEMQSARFEPLSSSSERQSARMSIYGASPMLTFSETSAGPYAQFPTEDTQQVYSPPPVGGAAGATLAGAPKDEHHTYAPAPMPRDEHHTYAPAPMPRDEHHTYAPAPKKPNTYSAPPVTTNEPMGQYGQFDTLEDGTYQQLEISK